LTKSWNRFGASPVDLPSLVLSDTNIGVYAGVLMGGEIAVGNALLMKSGM
jgi:hypothetical protein